MVALHTAIAIALVVGLIIKARVDPVISLIIGSLYLGLASGAGLMVTIEAISTGFGEIMAKVGLLIGFGVLIGSLLHATGAFKKMVDALVRVIPAKQMPYGMTTAMAMIFPPIYVDVQVVLAAPVARSVAKLIPKGLPLMAGALGIGIFAGYVFVIPGLAALSITGLLSISLAKYLAFGIVIGPVTALLTVLIFKLLVTRTPYWKPEQDEEQDEAMLEQEAADEVAAADAHSPSLLISVLPIVVPLTLIGFGAVAGVLEFGGEVVAFLGNATLALFLGLVGAYLIARRFIGTERTNEALSEGFHTSGEILLVTGVGGSLGAVIGASGLDQTLASLFSADAGSGVLVSILLAWFIAAVLHLAIGSVSVAAIAAAGIIAPVLDSISVNPIAIGLAIASGSLFALQVNSNFFWMYKALLGLSTQGALKTMTMVTSIGSLVSLPIVLAIALVI